MISLDYPDSVRWQHLLSLHTDNMLKSAKSPDYLLDKVTQPS